MNKEPSKKSKTGTEKENNKDYDSVAGSVSSVQKGVNEAQVGS